MSVHSHDKYSCARCGEDFIPFKEVSLCPKCGTKADKTIGDFVQFTVNAAMDHLTGRYGKFSPGAFFTTSIGDSYFMFAFNFLTWASGTIEPPTSGLTKERMLCQRTFTTKEAEDLALAYLKVANLGDRPYMANDFREYFTQILLILAPRYKIWVDWREEIAQKLKMGQPSSLYYTPFAF